MRALLLALLLAPPCHGHSGIAWESVSGEDSFRVWRCLAGACLLEQRFVDGVLKPFPSSLSQWTLVGDTLACNRAEYTDEDGEFSPRFICHHWEVLRASSVPAMNVSYDYSVQTVDALGRTSGGGNVVSCGPQDATTCIESGRPVGCP